MKYLTVELPSSINWQLLAGRESVGIALLFAWWQVLNTLKTRDASHSLTYLLTYLRTAVAVAVLRALRIHRRLLPAACSMIAHSNSQ